jgi:peptidoglycan/xylan/chitin deacetylase (PgdA/CDA1 family)
MSARLKQTASRMARRSLRYAAPFVSAEIPVLTYHSIDETGSLLSVAPSALRAQLARLRAENWRGLSIAEYIALAGKANPEPRTVLITFDDGYRNFAERAFPLLTEYGFRATLFVPVDFVGKRPSWLERDWKMTRLLLDDVGLSSDERRALNMSAQELLSNSLMDWPDLRNLTEAGIDIQSHSAAHHFLTSLAPEEIREDLIRSRKVLEDQLGRPVTAVAYPYGASDTVVAAAARDAGFDVGFVSDHGPRDDMRMMSWRGGVSGRLTPTELISVLQSWPLYPRLRHLLRQAKSLS